MPVKFFDGILNVEGAITYGMEVNRWMWCDVQLYVDGIRRTKRKRNQTIKAKFKKSLEKWRRKDEGRWGSQ